MNKYKICVYGICKNEEKFVNRWMDHVSEADLVVIVDTGSTDNTIELFKARGAIVYTMKENLFRFDHARNKCLEYIPEDIDICVSADIDDVIDFGWRAKLESAWNKDTTRGFYLYNWSFNEDGSPLVQYTHQRIHSRHGYHWIYPTHEILEYIGEKQEKGVFLEGVVYNHYPDGAKDRSLNLPLLELAVKENPDSIRNIHYLGREYLFAEKWDDCIKMLEMYLVHPLATWKEERAASMRFIARAYKAKKDFLLAKKWLYYSITEAPYTREPYVEMAQLAYLQTDWPAVFYFSTESLKVTEKTLGYVNEGFAWDATPYDLAALACYNLGMYKQAIEHSNSAILLEPNDARLLNNHHYYLEKLNLY